MFKEELEALRLQLIHTEKATEKYNEAYQRIDNILGNLDVTCDIHYRSGSWAVVSLQGYKSEFIKFVELDDRTIHEISRYLSQFERRNIKMDAPPGYIMAMPIMKMKKHR